MFGLSKILFRFIFVSNTSPLAYLTFQQKLMMKPTVVCVPSSQFANAEVPASQAYSIETFISKFVFYRICFVCCWKKTLCREITRRKLATFDAQPAIRRVFSNKINHRNDMILEFLQFSVFYIFSNPWTRFVEWINKSSIKFAKKVKNFAWINQFWWTQIFDSDIVFPSKRSPTLYTHLSAEVTV